MTYGYMPGLEQPGEFSVPIERRLGGYAIGIIRTDCALPFLPGDVANATTFNFPVLYRLVKGVTPERIFAADPALIDELITAGKELEKDGVRAIGGTTCGFYGNFQKEVAAALDVPVFLSSLLQVPLINRALKPDQKVGIITANSTALTPKLLSSCGVDDLSRVVIAGAQDLPEFKKLLLSTGHYNAAKIEPELVSLAKQLVKNNTDIGAILLECAQLPTFAWAIQNAVRLPVFDFSTMINWVYSAVVRRPFAGVI
ncbi:aspartate/glutamate racemase family protein [Chloroflexota bacterium]